MYRLATLLALLIALAAGCGSDEDGSKPSTPPAAQKEKDRAKDKPDAGKKKREEEKPAAEDGKGEKDDRPKSHKEVQQEAFDKLPAGERAELIRTVVRTTLSRFGLKVSHVGIADRGRTVKATITRKSACQAVASQEPNMVFVIKEGAPGVKSISFLVAGTGEEFGYYVLSCKHPTIPNGPGRVVLNYTAVGGPWTSRVFTIKADRWALEWENRGSSMGGIPIAVAGKYKGAYYKPIASQKPEAGRYNYRGAGKFQLKVSGAARWRVRVKEIR